jgi:hypothetical protein
MSSASTIRRSVALPRGLVEEVSSLAPKELRKNFNRLVITALAEFAKEQKARRFREEMAAMAQDPQVRSDCAAISKAFAAADADGLGRLP